MEHKKKKKSGRTNDDNKYIRDIRIEFRLSPIEYLAFTNRWEKSSHNSMASLTRSCIFGEEDKIEIHLNQKKQAGLDRLKVQGALGKIGSNFNQLAKQLNSKYDFITAKTLIAEMEKIRLELERISDLNNGE